MLGGGRQFVELVDDGAEQPVARCSVAQSYFNKIMRRRPVFLVLFELLCPKLFYGWVVVFACGIGWWCVAPAASFGIGVYVDYWLTDPGAARVAPLLPLACAASMRMTGRFCCIRVRWYAALCLLLLGPSSLRVTLLQPWRFSYLAAFCQRSRHPAAALLHAM
jgi:hypothetical protein